METEEQPQKAPDRRKALRSPIIVLKMSGEGEREHLFGYAKNISRSGLFIPSVNPRKPGEQFSISFRIPNTEIQVRCRCEIVWMREYRKKMSLESGYGVRFLDLPEDVAEAIDRWVKQQS
ncbi:MAG: PilZ domain-containing protein [Nitrospirae bacterium]|nr:PilZ domain-containing protein [Nitrospirota bacterium]